LVEQFSLPKNWQWLRLGDLILTIKNGIVREQTFDGIGFRLARIETISSGTVDPEKTGWSDLPVEKFKDYKLKYGDILFSHINSVEKLGNCAIYEGVPENLYHGMNLLLIRANENLLVPHFFLYWLKSNYCKAYYRKNARRAIGQASLNQTDIRGIAVPVPTLPEQKRISEDIRELIEEAERAQTACEKQLGAINALPAVYLSQVFESEQAEKWERKRLGEIIHSETGFWGEEPDNPSESHFILRSSNIKDGEIFYDEVAIRKVEPRHLSKKSLKTGDILVAISSGSKNLVGKSAIFIPPDDRIYLFSNFTMRLRVITGLVDAFYLCFYLQSPRAKNALKSMQDTTTGLRNLNRREFLKQPVPLPPSLEEQRRIALNHRAKLVEIQKLKTTIQKQMQALLHLPQAILRKAFRDDA